MQRTFLKSKLHRLTVTDANLDYEGSISLDTNLMKIADIMPFEQVHIWDVTNGERIMTYAIEGEKGTGMVCVNGAAAHKIRAGDIVIIASYAMLNETELATFKPKAIKVDNKNRPIL